MSNTLFNLTEKQVSTEFGIPRNSLRVSRSTGLLWGVPSPAYIKIGYKVIYERKTIEAWFAQFKPVGNTAQAKMEGV